MDCLNILKHSDKSCPVLKGFKKAVYLVAEKEGISVPDLLTKIETFLKEKANGIPTIPIKTRNLRDNY